MAGCTSELSVEVANTGAAPLRSNFPDEFSRFAEQGEFLQASPHLGCRHPAGGTPSTREGAQAPFLDEGRIISSLESDQHHALQAGATQARVEKWTEQLCPAILRDQG